MAATGHFISIFYMSTHYRHVLLRAKRVWNCPTILGKVSRCIYDRNELLLWFVFGGTMLWSDATGLWSLPQLPRRLNTIEPSRQMGFIGHAMLIYKSDAFLAGTSLGIKAESMKMHGCTGCEMLPRCFYYDINSILPGLGYFMNTALRTFSKLTIQELTSESTACLLQTLSSALGSRAFESHDRNWK